MEGEDTPPPSSDGKIDVQKGVTGLPPSTDLLEGQGGKPPQGVGKPSPPPPPKKN